MSKTDKPKSYWLGLIVLYYSLFLLLQGIWVWGNYPSLYPVIIDPFGYVPNNYWVFHIIGAIAPSCVGGIIFMAVGFFLFTKNDKPKLSVCLSFIGFSFILLLQSMWILFIFPNYYRELMWYLTTNIFTNFPRFFGMLGVLIPPIVGFAIFMVAGLVLTKMRLQRNNQ